MSYQVIARKYRPQQFDDVVGQKLVTETLKNAIQHNRVAHGYIFSGARGVGKTTTARILAKALNCFEGPTVTPCGRCPSCQEIGAGNSVDVLELDAASNRGIDEIRQLRETVRYLPARDRSKIFIIDEAHMLTPEAFNALLKTLEEPPPRSLFLLATTEPHKLPSTIQSRCQHFAFRLLEYPEILARLEWVCAQEKIHADEGSLSALTQAAEGSLRDALSLLDQVIASSGERLVEGHVRRVLGVVPSRVLGEMVEAVHAGEGRQVLERMAQVAAEGYELPQFCRELTRYVRNLTVAKSCGIESLLLQVPQEERETLGRLAGLFSEEDLSRFFQVLLRTNEEMRYSLEPRLHLELGLLKLVHARRLEPLEHLLSELRGAAPGKLEPSKGLSGPAAPRGSPGPGGPSVRSAPEGSAPSGAALASAAGQGGTREDPRLGAIKSLLFAQSKKFLSSCLEHVAGWRLEDGEARFLYSKKESWAADFLKSHEHLEALQDACARVLGFPVKICVRLEADEGEAARPTARERAERDARVQDILQKFDCTWMSVTDLSQE